MKKLLPFILIFVSLISLSAQDISSLRVSSGSKKFDVPVYDREGSVYISIKSLANGLSIDNSYDKEADRIKLTFDNYSLYITSKNPFLVLINKNDGAQEVIQLPTSTYFVKGQIYIPLQYSLPALVKASGMNFKFDAPANLIVEKAKSSEQPVPVVNAPKTKSSGFDITGLSLNEKSNGMIVNVISKKRIFSYNSSVKDNVITFELRNVQADTSYLNSREFTGGMVKWIKAKNVKSDVELNIGIGKEYNGSEVINVDNSNNLMIALYNKVFEHHASKKNVKDKWDFNVIVIDAGHGGKDSGTLGVDGVKEKDINLAVALKLGSLIQEGMKDVKVVYTRKSDKFIELYRRGQIANEAGGKLFISIHCNATPEKPSNANGLEVYLLRPGRTKEAISIASRENSVIKYEDNPARYKKLTDENFILVSMAQSSYMRYSEKFADLVNKEVAKDASIEPKGVKQAGFYVLVGASMPSVLIETGFLSNRKDEKYLDSSRGQTQIAKSIFGAIKKFREIYEKNIESE